VIPILESGLLSGLHRQMRMERSLAITARRPGSEGRRRCDLVDSGPRDLSGIEGGLIECAHQVLASDPGAVAGHRGEIQNLVEFVCVARPGILVQQPGTLLGQSLVKTSELLSTAQVVLCEKFDVVAASTERWQLDPSPIEAGMEVLAE